MLDGFPRNVAQAEALERMLHEKGLDLDGVVELKVDEGQLVRRIESRIKETLARGEPLRKDDDPEVLKTRLDAYRRQTAPLIHHYREKNLIRAVDGMAPMDEVTAAINWIFAKPKPQKTSTKAATSQKTQAEIDQSGRCAEEAQADCPEVRQGGGPVGQSEGKQGGCGQEAGGQEGSLKGSEKERKTPLIPSLEEVDGPTWNPLIPGIRFA